MSIKLNLFFVFSIVLPLVAGCNSSENPTTQYPLANSIVETIPAVESTYTQQSPLAQTENKYPLLAFFGGWDNGIYTIDEIGGSPNKVFDRLVGGGPNGLSMSPNCAEYVYTQALGNDPDVSDQLYHFSTKNQTLTRLTDPTEVDIINDPSWSPDGKQIAFLGVGKGRGVSEVYIINNDGSNLQRLPGLSNKNAGCLEWSPDGTKFAYAKVDGEYSSYGVMDSDGANLHEILKVDGYNLPSNCVSWSPDSRKILFLVQRLNEENLGFYSHDFAIVNSDGTDLHYITKPSADPAYANSDEFEPAWSPDGNHIAFSYVQMGNDNSPWQQYIYITDLAGTNRVISIGATEFGILMPGANPTWCSQRK